MKGAVRRKRYLLLTSESEVRPDDRKEAVRLLLQRYPELDPKKMVWVNNSLILRTDQLKLPEMKLGLAIRVGVSILLLPKRASGSISKLKRAAEPPAARTNWSSSSQRTTSRKLNRS